MDDQIVYHLCDTALSRMILARSDVVTVTKIAGHSTIRMLERYAHSATPQRTAALESARVVTIWSQWPKAKIVRKKGPAVTGPSCATYGGGRQEARTPDLRVANAALSQLS